MRRALSLLALSACSFDHGHVRSDSLIDIGDPISDTLDATGGCKAVAIAASGGHTCAARNDGSVRCWGKNGQGELGRPPMDSMLCLVEAQFWQCEPTPIDPKVPANVTALGMGDQHGCAIGDGKVYCWGANDSGQFGDGATGDHYSPTVVPMRAGAVSIAGGNTHTCSLASGTLSCSGGNNEGEVGNNSTNNAFTPYPSRSGVPAFGVGFQNTYALTTSGDVYGWGDNSTRQVDNSGQDPRTVATQISGITGATAVAGGTGHACAVLANQTAACWGANGGGQLGRNTTSTQEAPAAVTVVTGTISTLAAGVNHTCVKRTDKTVVCWGEGYSTAGVQIALPRAAEAITAGSYHDCAILDDGSVWCWGWNAYGQIGNGTSGTAIDNTPRQALICQ